MFEQKYEGEKGEGDGREKVVREGLDINRRNKSGRGEIKEIEFRKVRHNTTLLNAQSTILAHHHLNKSWEQ